MTTARSPAPCNTRLSLSFLLSAKPTPNCYYPTNSVALTEGEASGRPISPQSVSSSSIRVPVSLSALGLSKRRMSGVRQVTERPFAAQVGSCTSVPRGVGRDPLDLGTPEGGRFWVRNGDALPTMPSSFLWKALRDTEWHSQVGTQALPWTKRDPVWYQGPDQQANMIFL